VVVARAWVGSLRRSDRIESEEKACDRKRQRRPLPELVVIDSLFDLDFASEFLLQLGARQPKSVDSAQAPIFTLFIIVAGLRWHNNSMPSCFCSEPLSFAFVDRIEHRVALKAPR